MPLLDENQWEEFLANYPHAHILQTPQWGRFKSQHGWYAFRIKNQNAGAQILFRRLPLNLTIAYIPKGPVGQDWSDLLAEAQQISRQEKAIALYVEPDCWQEDIDALAPSLQGFSPAGMSIQPRRTITISLKETEEEWLACMKQKTRYNIRLAGKKGVVVAKSEDVDVFNRLMKETGARDEFGIHPPSYYRSVYEIFHPSGACEMFLASYENQPLAAIMVFKRGKRAWYFYGASNNRERNRMPTYLLQWEAMRWAAASGCTEYDLWGVPDAEKDILEEQFMNRSDGLWGVYRFKRGFGGELKRSAGVFVKVLRPGLYRAYQLAMKIRKSGLA
jgi:lipid II:glycine glycyltransferase (peptidoglycan interpeptide bridge formation enzyme)